MSDEFFRKTFGDAESVSLGSGWVSGISAVFLGLLSVGGVLCLRFPALLTLPEARAHYPMGVIRLVIQGTILAAFLFAAASAILRQRKVLALTGAALALAAAALGGGTVPLPQEITTKTGIGLDWFLLDLLVMTIVFVPLERIWPLHPNQGTFRAEWTTDAFYFVATHLPSQLINFLMLLPAALAAPWLAIPQLQAYVRNWPFVVQLLAVILVADLSQYLVHRMFHKVPALWRFHAVHHSIRTMDWIAGSRSHFFDIVVTRGLIMIPLALCGFSQGAIIGYILFVSFHATFSHIDFFSAHHLAGELPRHAALPSLASLGSRRSDRLQFRHPLSVDRPLVRDLLFPQGSLAEKLRPERHLGSSGFLQTVHRPIHGPLSSALETEFQIGQVRRPYVSRL